jgi:hypothetical protein
MRGGNQIIFIQPGPDMFLGGELKSLNFSLTLTGNQQIRFNLRQSPFQLRVEVLNNRFTLRPFVDIFYQGSLNAHRFALALVLISRSSIPWLRSHSIRPNLPKRLSSIARSLFCTSSQVLSPMLELRGGNLADPGSSIAATF